MNLPDPTPLPILYHTCAKDRWCLSFNCVHDETLSPKKPEFREIHIQLPTFKNEMHIRKRNLANRWRVFRKLFLLELGKVKSITLVVLTLHNWLRKESDISKEYFSPTLVDREDPETGEIIEGSWRKEIPTESWQSLSNAQSC